MFSQNCLSMCGQNVLQFYIVVRVQIYVFLQQIKYSLDVFPYSPMCMQYGITS